MLRNGEMANTDACQKFCCNQTAGHSGHWCHDVLYWWPNKDGIYTVRSGYWLARGGYIRAWQTQNGVEDIDRWHHVWKVEGPPKL